MYNGRVIMECLIVCLVLRRRIFHFTELEMKTAALQAARREGFWRGLVDLSLLYHVIF